MLSNDRQPVVLLVTNDRMLAERALKDLRRLEQIAVAVDTCDVALEMMDAVEFALVIVDVEAAADWWTCQRVLQSHRAPVAILTRFLAPDRRYRRWAFEAGVNAYVCKPCTTSRLRKLLGRLHRGEPCVEVVDGTAYCECA
jgi:AmiR/NasT family two-component response regulator